MLIANQVLPSTATIRFRADASYMVVSGMSGIGWSICQWMAERGVKNLVVLSRNASRKEQRGLFMSEMADLGCKALILDCDISHRDDLARALEFYRKSMPPVRGIIQSAMVLQ